MQVYKKEVDGRQFQIAEYPGEKGPIVALHGLTGTHKNMHFYAEALQGIYRVITVDLRGRGDSSPLDEEPSIFKHADDIRNLLEALDIENPILLGHSMGAFISAILASQIPTQALILLDGAAQMSEQQMETVKPSLGRLQKQYPSKEAYLDKVKELYHRLGVEWSPDLNDIVEYDIEPVQDYWQHKSAGEKILEDFESFYTFKAKEIMQNVTCDTLLVFAEGSIGPYPPFFNQEDYADTIKYTDKLTTFLSTCNHYNLIFERNEEIHQTIIEFLKRVNADGERITIF